MSIRPARVPVRTPVGKPLQAFVLFLGVLLLAGCAGRSHDLFGVEPPVTDFSSAIASERIFVATTRARSDDPRVVFDGQRSETTSYAEVEMTIPPVHKVGNIERPKSARPDASKFMTARSLKVLSDEDALVDAIAAEAQKVGGRALVFVHGYRTSFDNAIYRITQIAHDSDYGGAAVLFSWASGGRTIDYVYDRDSANAARDQLEELLRKLARSGVSRIDIVAHSMGTWLTMEAMRGLAIAGDRDLNGKLGDVVLASPDIDVDVFKSQMRRFGKPDRPFAVMLSGDDRALQISGLIAGQRPRLGDYRKASEIADLGVIVVDLSNVESGDSLNHAKFADNPVLIRLLGENLRTEDTASDANVEDRLTRLVQGLGSTVGAAAELVITTPTTVISTVVGGG